MKIAILGAGPVGKALTHLYCENPTVKAVNVIDQNGNALSELEQFCRHQKLRTYRVNIERERSLLSLLKGFDCVISALPHEYNIKLAEMAIEIGINYIDFGGHDDVLEEQMKLTDKAQTRERWVIPNCGLAPGLVNILAMHGFETFDRTDQIQIWSAGLPTDPTPPFNFHIAFSPAGLISEYVNPSLIIEDGQLKQVPSLEGYEMIRFDTKPEVGELESFYVSGNITSLAKNLEGKVNLLTYKTLRYPGHRDIVKALMDLGFGSGQIIDIRTNLTYRDLLIRQVRKNLPAGKEDCVLVKVLIEGILDGEKVCREYELIHDYTEEDKLSAMMACTTIPTVIISELIGEHKLIGNGGVFTPEMVVPKEEFLKRLRDKGLNLRISETVEEHAVTE